MDNNVLEHSAMEMIAQHRSGSRFKNLSQEFQPKNLTDAYEAQDMFHRLSNRGILGGFKIALASKVQQELTGVNHPLYGGIFAKEIIMSPAKIPFKSNLSLGLEFELAVTISQEITSEAGLFDKNSVRAIIDIVCPAFEIIIDRGADYADLDPMSMVVDNVWCGGVVLGAPVPNWQRIELNKLDATLMWNDRPPETALVGDANPLDSLVWLINSLLVRNKKIPKGAVIITGSVFKTRNTKIGDQIKYIIGTNSKVQVDIV